MDAARRHNLRVGGRAGSQPMVFAHGFGCDQRMWRLVAPHFEGDHMVVLYDLAGAGGADPAAYDPDRHATLDGYADDIVGIVEELDLSDVVLVGRSVSAMTAVLASLRAPGAFSDLVLVAPSPRYLNDEGYVGGFDEADIAELLESLDSNYLGWSAATAPMIVGNPDRPELGRELTESFCRTSPEIASGSARVTFLSDNRADLPGVTTPTLILQCQDDILAPVEVGEDVHRAIPGSTLVQLDASGHGPHLSDPEATIRAIEEHLR